MMSSEGVPVEYHLADSPRSANKTINTTTPSIDEPPPAKNFHFKQENYRTKPSCKLRWYRTIQFEMLTESVDSSLKRIEKFLQCLKWAMEVAVGHFKKTLYKYVSLFFIAAHPTYQQCIITVLKRAMWPWAYDILPRWNMCCAWFKCAQSST